MQKEWIDKRVTEFKKKYELSELDEFNVHMVFDLEEEYMALSNKNPDHTRRRSEILKMRRLLKEEISHLQKKEKTICLFNEQDYTVSKRDGDSLILEANMDVMLQNRLTQGQQEGKLIDTKNFRAIGKTYNLIKFAKTHGYAVIEPHDASYFRELYRYDEIYNQGNILRGMRNNGFVIDEGVDINRVKNELGFNIITGYINK